MKSIKKYKIKGFNFIHFFSNLKNKYFKATLMVIDESIIFPPIIRLLVNLTMTDKTCHKVIVYRGLYIKLSFN
jgi:hypothetical protein